MGQFPDVKISDVDARGMDLWKLLRVLVEDVVVDDQDRPN